MRSQSICSAVSPHIGIGPLRLTLPPSLSGLPPTLLHPSPASQRRYATRANTTHRVGVYMLHSKATEEPASYLQRVEKPQDFAPMTVAQSESLDGFFHRPPHAAQHACTRTFQRVCSVYHKHDQCPMILCAGILRGPFTSTFTFTFTSTVPLCHSVVFCPAPRKSI